MNYISGYTIADDIRTIKLFCKFKHSDLREALKIICCARAIAMPEYDLRHYEDKVALQAFAQKCIEILEQRVCK